MDIPVIGCHQATHNVTVHIIHKLRKLTVVALKTVQNKFFSFNENGPNTPVIRYNAGVQYGINFNTITNDTLLWQSGVNILVLNNPSTVRLSVRRCGDVYIGIETKAPDYEPVEIKTAWIGKAEVYKNS